MELTEGEFKGNIIKIFTGIREITEFMRQKGSYEKNQIEDFPGGAVVKNPPANAGDTGSRPSLGRSHMPRSN